MNLEDESRSMMLSASDGQILFTLPERVGSAEFSPKGNLVVITHDNGDASELYQDKDLLHSSNGEVAYLTSDGEKIRLVEFSALGNYLLVESRGGSRELVSSKNGSLMPIKNDELFYSAEFSPDESAVLISGAQPHAHVILLNDPAISFDLSGPSITKSWFSRTGCILFVEYASQNGGGSIVSFPTELRNLCTDGRVVASFDGSERSQEIPVPGPRDSFLFAGQLRDGTNGNLLYETSSSISDIWFSDDNTTPSYLVNYNNGWYELRDTRTNELHSRFNQRVKSVTLIGDSEKLILLTEDGKSNLIDLNWLAEIQGRANDLPIETLIELACKYPLRDGLPNDSELRAYFPDREPPLFRACDQYR